MTNATFFSPEYQTARKKALDELTAESQRLNVYHLTPSDYLSPQLGHITPQQVYEQHLIAIEAQKKHNPTLGFSDLTNQLNTLKQSDPHSRTGDQKLIEELHRLAAENRDLKRQLASLSLEPHKATRLSASWEHLPDIIPTIISRPSHAATDFPFTALRRGNKQTVGLMTERPT